MSLLFGPSRRDQVHLLSTLQSLHTTSIAGLSAALSWSDRKTERVLREVLTQTGSAVVYDPRRRTVGVRSAATSNPQISTTVSGGLAEGSAVASTPTSAPTSPAPILPKEFGGGGRCPRCQVPLLPTATGDAAVCPKCGQMSTRRGRPAAPAASPSAIEVRAPSGSAPSAPLPENGRTVVQSGDRRSQELFAAWVTARPIPCPRCRSTLQHRGVGEYGCPTCGHRVAFETSGIGGSARARAGPPGPGPIN
ncbi:MAG: hypothetical protein L3K17_03775 [Thermoplasmata archaeon]|nr:hypothetical protein [Thermoplasmata archaeon]